MPLSRAPSSASWSTSAPRAIGQLDAVLHRQPGRRRSGDARVSPVRRRRRGRAPSSTSPSDCAHDAGAAGVATAPVQRPMSKAAPGGRPAVPIAPMPTRPSVVPSTRPSSAVFHRGGGSVIYDSGSCFSNGEHHGQHPLGDGSALAPVSTSSAGPRAPRMGSRPRPSRARAPTRTASGQAAVGRGPSPHVVERRAAPRPARATRPRGRRAPARRSVGESRAGAPNRR